MQMHSSQHVRSPASALGASGTIAPARSIGPADAVVGLQWGDEGKGKIIDILAAGYDAVVRYNGGANAGHSVVFGGNRYALHLVPSGIFHQGTRAVIGNGVVVDPQALLTEIDRLSEKGVDVSGLALSSRAHLVLPYHKIEDERREKALRDGDQDQSIGTTRRGIGPAYAEKAHRSAAFRVGDLLDVDAMAPRLRQTVEQYNTQFSSLDVAGAPIDPDQLLADARQWSSILEPHITDTVYLLNELLAQGKSLLFEGANATLLDIDHGTFPFVTSSNCSVLGIPAGSGVPGHRIRSVTGVMKAYCTRVGGGPFPTEQTNDVGQRIRDRGNEYGTTTGRPRRCGWLDLVAGRYAVMLNGVTSIALMLFDVLSGFDELKVCTAYEIDGQRSTRFLPDAAQLARATPVYESLPGWQAEITTCRSLQELPAEARGYLDFVQATLGVPLSFVSVGPDRQQTIAL